MDTISLTTEELDALIERVESSSLQKGDAEIIKAMANAVKLLSQAVNDKAVSIKKLLSMVFGPKTEKKDNVLKPRSLGTRKKDKPVPKEGHGRRPGKDFTGAERKSVPHEEFKHKDPCPLCPKGILYQLQKPGQTIYFTGQVPINATIHELEKLRCNLCGMVFTAQAPDNKTGRDYDASAMAMIPLFKYGYGFPWSRLAKLQESLGIPLAATTQWDKTEAAANLIHPVFRELIRQAAQGDIIHNDDTTMKILSLVQENKDRTSGERTGIFTTGIISRIGDDKQIALFYTGRNHAGENIADLYRKRDPGRPPPVQMCDALSRNTTDEFNAILCNCLTHGRRHFVNEIDNFPQEAEHVIEVLAEVYCIDARTKKEKMTPDQRLDFHREHSGPLMADLKSWLDRQIDENLVEPNSGLGKAITYMDNHWTKLTRFLEVPGAPLDNNICERSLKRCIQHRKNSLFYKTEHGAYIGDMFMSLIHTCNLMGVNPFDYLITLIENSSALSKDPSKWLPWNYKANLP
jgi:transposase